MKELGRNLFGLAVPGSRWGERPRCPPQCYAGGDRGQLARGWMRAWPARWGRAHTVVAKLPGHLPVYQGAARNRYPAEEDGEPARIRRPPWRSPSRAADRTLQAMRRQHRPPSPRMAAYVVKRVQDVDHQTRGPLALLVAVLCARPRARPPSPAPTREPMSILSRRARPWGFYREPGPAPSSG